MPDRAILRQLVTNESPPWVRRALRAYLRAGRDGEQPRFGDFLVAYRPTAAEPGPQGAP